MGLTRDELQSMLDARDGYWDRPDSEWGDPDGDWEEKLAANSYYRLARKALRRENQQDLATATNWAGLAADARHPGGAFLALVCHLRDPRDADDDRWATTTARHLTNAAHAGHGDAQNIFNELACDTQFFPEAPDEVQEPEFLPEVRSGIGFPKTPQ